MSFEGRWVVQVRVEELLGGVENSLVDLAAFGVDRMVGAARFGHVGQADENARLVAAADVALVPDAQRGGFGVESERPAHIDRTGGTQNFAERSDENVSGGFLDDDIGGLQLRAVLSGRAGTGIVLPGGDVVARPDRGGTGVARSPELLSALGVRIPRVARLVPLFEAGVRNLDTGGGRGQIENYGWTNATYNSLLTINYDWRINDDWGLNAVAGNEFIQSNRKKYYEYGTNYNFAGWNHINNATTQLTEEERWKNRTVGFFGNVSASYRNMLYLTVTGRQDYVSNMPRNNRSFFYPSVSAGFILTELDELKNDVVNYAKLRVSYAEVGQAGDFLENYYSTPTYGGGFYSLTPIMYPIKGTTAYTPYYTIFDPNLKPQNTRSYEIGADVNFFDNLITLNYTYSRQNVKDQIFSVPLASSTGASKLLTNGGKIHTDTHEITLGFNPIRTKNINWDFGFNWTKIDNYVDELAPGVENISLGGYVTPQVRASAGEKFPVIYGVGYKRDANGNRLVDENGLPVAGEAQVIGKVSPDFVMGFNTSLRLWKCTISAVLDWKQGGQMYSRTTGLSDYYGVSKRTENREGTIIFDGYKQDGTKNDIAITGANAQQVYYSRLNDIDESSVYDNSFIKLREVAVSYKVLQKKWMELSVNAFARNILVWAQMPDLDPEASQGNNNMSGAFEDYSMPQTASFGFGFNIKF